MFLTASADVTHPNVPGPFLDNVKMVAEIAENPVINRGARGTGWSALAVAEMIAGYLHQFRGGGEERTLLVQGENALQRVSPPEGATVAYHVRLTTTDGFRVMVDAN
jgi:hypothetical protein